MSTSSVKFQTNVPERVALAFAEGLPVASQFGGDQVMFSLVDGRKMYVAPIVAQKIAGLGIGSHEEFEICKREQTVGNRRVVNYEVAVARAVAPAAAAGPVAVPRTAPAPAAPAAAAPASSADALKYAGMAAIDAVLAVEAYARSKGMTDFFFGADNVQKIWATIYIDARKGGRA